MYCVHYLSSVISGHYCKVCWCVYHMCQILKLLFLTYTLRMMLFSLFSSCLLLRIMCLDYDNITYNYCDCCFKFNSYDDNVAFDIMHACVFSMLFADIVIPCSFVRVPFKTSNKKIMQAIPVINSLHVHQAAVCPVFPVRFRFVSKFFT